MGLFDAFSAQPAQNAAQDQINGLNRGFSLASGNLTQGLNTGTNYLTNGSNSSARHAASRRSGRGRRGKQRLQWRPFHAAELVRRGRQFRRDRNQ
jgi:hypothetical protein